MKRLVGLECGGGVGIEITSVFSGQNLNYVVVCSWRFLLLPVTDTWGQTVNISGFAGHIRSVAMTQFSHCNAKAATDNMKTNGHGCFNTECNFIYGH